MAQILTNPTQTAVFFELDNVVRQIKPDIARAMKEERGMMPPAPFAVGMQELIAPVINHIKMLCEATGAIPIGLDQAPYVEDAEQLRKQGHDVEFSIDDYKEVLAETLHLLKSAGLTKTKLLYCPHKPFEKVEYDLMGNRSKIQHIPRCQCRFPNAGLIFHAVKVYGIKYEKSHGRVRIWSPQDNYPSHMISATPEAREASVSGAQMDHSNVVSILDGSIYLRDNVTWEHLKMAERLREHQRSQGLTATHTGREMEVNLEGLGNLPELPQHLHKPTVSLRKDRL